MPGRLKFGVRGLTRAANDERASAAPMDAQPDHAEIRTHRTEGRHVGRRRVLGLRLGNG